MSFLNFLWPFYSSFQCLRKRSLFTAHTFPFQMSTHCSVLAWRIAVTGEPGGLPSMGSHRVRHNWSDLVAAAAFPFQTARQSWITWLHDLGLLVNFSPLKTLSVIPQDTPTLIAYNLFLVYLSVWVAAGNRWYAKFSLILVELPKGSFYREVGRM